MFYRAVFTKKKRFFQKAYTIKGNVIYITDTFGAKKKFLKSGIRNVIFTHEAGEDKVFKELLKPIYAYDRQFMLNYLDNMIAELATFWKIDFPIESVAVSSPDAKECALRYAKSVTVMGEGEDEVVDGINVMYTKRLKTIPKMAIICDEGVMPPLPGVPTIDISAKPRRGRFCLTWETMSFKCGMFPFEIGAESLVYLINAGEDMTFELASLRKISPLLFTFY